MILINLIKESTYISEGVQYYYYLYKTTENLLYNLIAYLKYIYVLYILCVFNEKIIDNYINVLVLKIIYTAIKSLTDFNDNYLFIYMT